MSIRKTLTWPVSYIVICALTASVAVAEGIAVVYMLTGCCRYGSVVEQMQTNEHAAMEAAQGAENE